MEVRRQRMEKVNSFMIRHSIPPYFRRVVRELVACLLLDAWEGSSCALARACVLNNHSPATAKAASHDRQGSPSNTVRLLHRAYVCVKSSHHQVVDYFTFIMDRKAEAGVLTELPDAIQCRLQLLLNRSVTSATACTHMRARAPNVQQTTTHLHSTRQQRMIPTLPPINNHHPHPLTETSSRPSPHALSALA
jgi:hypothetical protein